MKKIAAGHPFKIPGSAPVVGGVMCINFCDKVSQLQVITNKIVPSQTATMTGCTDSDSWYLNFYPARACASKGLCDWSWHRYYDTEQDWKPPTHSH